VRLADVYRHSLVIVSDFRIPDAHRAWSLLEQREDALAAIGAHHIAVCRSIGERRRFLVLIGVRSREPVVDLLRSRELFGWFDAVGVEDIPAVFAGEIADRYELAEPDSDSGGEPDPGVVVSAILEVADPVLLMNQMHSAKEAFKAAGVRKVWVFRALDDSNEVFILQELESERHARSWIRHHDASADWMEFGGVGVYPPLFIGEPVRMIKVDETG
jgi:hypothetical protein